jgi:antirestriction protein ArdC
MNRQEAEKLSQRSLEDLLAQLEAGKSDSLTRLLRALAMFHEYSVGNVMMILSQRPDAKRVAGIHAWNKLKRYVRKGERGIAIFAPMRFKEEEEGAEARERLAFRVVHVFDLSQTEGEALPEAETVKGDPATYLFLLKQVVAAKGIQLEYHDELGSALGKSCKGTIKLVRGLPAAQEYAVLAHELAHEVMHVHRKELTRERVELEAEAVAFVLCRHAGLESGTAHSDYIQLYFGNADALTDSLEVIQRTAAGIIEAMSRKEAALVSRLS